MKITTDKFKRIMGPFCLVILGICAMVVMTIMMQNISQESNKKVKEHNTNITNEPTINNSQEDILGDIQIKLNSYKIGTHPDTSRPVLIVDYIVKNNGSESINFNKRYSTEATFKLSYFLEDIFKHRETVNLTEVSSKSSSSNDEEILSGETRLIKRYFVLPNNNIFYERDWGTYLNFTTTILDIQSGQSITKSFKL